MILRVPSLIPFLALVTSNERCWVISAKRRRAADGPGKTTCAILSARLPRTPLSLATLRVRLPPPKRPHFVSDFFSAEKAQKRGSRR
jgi:hypothetical protein